MPWLRQFVTMETRIQHQASLCRVCGGQSGMGTEFPLSVSCHRHSVFVHWFIRHQCYIISVVDSICSSCCVLYSLRTNSIQLNPTVSFINIVCLVFSQNI